MRKRAGFTLIEIIATLVLVGFLGALAGMGLLQGVEGYMLARDNAHLAQKAQVAGLRLARELMELSDVSSAAATSIRYTNPTGQHGIALVGASLKMNDGALPGPATGHILIENVTAFTLTYFKGGSAWQSGTDDIRDLTAIQISLSVAHPDGTIADQVFVTSINPRNTGVKAGPHGSTGS
jgi:prepilin-type N-terminal cleavage/methylation domain-containing protein